MPPRTQAHAGTRSPARGRGERAGHGSVGTGDGDLFRVPTARDSQSHPCAARSRAGVSLGQRSECRSVRDEAGLGLAQDPQGHPPHFGASSADGRDVPLWGAWVTHGPGAAAVPFLVTPLAGLGAATCV